MPIRSFTFYITNPALLRCWISYNTWCALYVGNRSRGMLGPRPTLVEGPKKGQMRRGTEPAGMSRSFPPSSHIFCLNMLLLHTWYQASSAIIWNIRFCSSTMSSHIFCSCYCYCYGMLPHICKHTVDKAASVTKQCYRYCYGMLPLDPHIICNWQICAKSKTLSAENHTF